MKLTLERNDLVPPGTWPWWLMALTLTLLWRALLRRTSQHRSDGGIAHRRDAPYRRAVRAVERCNRESALAFPAAARVPLRARVPVADGGASRLHLRAGDWRVARPLPVPMCGAYAVVREGHLYAFSAGHSAYSASVGEGNALGPWQAVGEDMPRTTSGAAWVAGPTRIYLAPASAQREGTPLFSAAFRPGGRLGSWRLEVGLPVGLSHAALAIHDDLLVLAGGRDRRGASARVYTAPLERAGRVGRWQGTASLPSPLVGHALASAAGALLVLGGRTPDGRADASVYRALFASGTLSGWMECAGLPSSRAQAGVATHQGAVLVFGGESRAPHDDVLVGDAGQWRAASLRLPSALCGAAAAVSDHALFLLGGQDRQRRTDVATRVLVYAPALAGHAWPT